MKFDEDDVRKGIKAASERTQGQLAFYMRPDAELTPRLIHVLEDWPSEAHPRFVTLFAELSAIAETARLAYREPRLGEEEIRAFLGHSFTFFNSFTHR